MSISTRKIGVVVACPTCGENLLVPEQDDLELPGSRTAPPEPVIAPPPIEPSGADAVRFDAIFADEPATPVPVVQVPERPAPEPEPPATPIPPLVRPPLPSDVRERFELPAPPAEARVERTTPLHETEDDADDGSFPQQAPRFQQDELDLTAMVDVVFQLLIFFMVTASFSLQKTIEVPTPDQPKQGVSAALQPLEELQDVAILVNIDDRNAVTIDDEPLGDLSQLTDTLREHMRRDQKSELILTAARNATHRTVIAVVDAANEAGMQRIRMATSRAAE